MEQEKLENYQGDCWFMDKWPQMVSGRQKPLLLEFFVNRCQEVRNNGSLGRGPQACKHRIIEEGEMRE